MGSRVARKSIDTTSMILHLYIYNLPAVLVSKLVLVMDVRRNKDKPVMWLYQIEPIEGYPRATI
jgi:hypothetical protein